MRRDASEAIIARVDRQRSKALSDARRLRIREVARAQVNLGAKSYDESLDRLEWVKAAAWKLRELFVTLQDDAGACAFFGSLAHAPESVLPKAIAAARAEQAFDKLTGASE